MHAEPLAERPPTADADSGEEESLQDFAARWWEAQRGVLEEQAALAASQARLALFRVAAALASAVLAAGLVLSAWIFLMLGAAAGLRAVVDVPGVGLATVAVVNGLLALFIWRALADNVRALGARLAAQGPSTGDADPDGNPERGDDVG